MAIVTDSCYHCTNFMMLNWMQWPLFELCSDIVYFHCIHMVLLKHRHDLGTRSLYEHNNCCIFFPIELPKTKEEFEERLIFKSFFLKSMNAFAPIFYVAFFKGRCVSFIKSLTSHQHRPLFFIISCDLVLSSYRFAGRPGDYVYVFGDYRMEEVGWLTLLHYISRLCVVVSHLCGHTIYYIVNLCHVSK